ncbi:hypothetical protein F5X99DRAFT_407405 [Biscogniauxia marginata]|nr:hypothetical protein F5X99DRAFT_407405 [Biscogniauxia marginata]
MKFYFTLDPWFHLNIAARDVSNWLEKAGRDVSLALGDLVQAIEGIFRGTAAWTREANTNLHQDPGRTILNAVLNVIKAGLMFAPTLLWGAVLKAFGFGRRELDLSWIGDVIAAGSPFAFFQSAGAGGYAAAALNTLVRGGVLVWSGGEWMANKWNTG